MTSHNFEDFSYPPSPCCHTYIHVFTWAFILGVTPIEPPPTLSSDAIYECSHTEFIWIMNELCCELKSLHKNQEWKIDPRSQVVKKCNQSYVLNSTTVQSEVELICSYDYNPAKPEFRVVGTMAPEPMCTHHCTKNENCVPGKEACVSNRFVDQCFPTV